MSILFFCKKTTLQMKKLAYFLFFSLIITSCIYKQASDVSPSISINTTNGGTTNSNPTSSAAENKPPAQLACATSNTVPTTVCFDTQVLPILFANCAESGCHDSKTKSQGYDFTNYNGILKGLTAGNSKNSKIYSEMSKGSMPTAPRKMATDQIAIVKQWIDEGAKNTTCGALVIDAINPTFAKTIKPMLDINCVGCHQKNAAQSSVILDNYTSVKNYVDNRKLWGVINYQVGYVGMPENRKLGTCQIDAFKKWIDAGALNN
jgi:hypothetical protein